MNPPYGRGGPYAGSDRTVAATPTASRVAASATTPSRATTNNTQSATNRRSDGQYGQYGPYGGPRGNTRGGLTELTPAPDSWVEVDSQPSSSSVSSIAEEIVITGLRVGYGASVPNGGSMPVVPQRRRRLLQQVEAAAATRPSALSAPASTSASASTSATAAAPQRRVGAPAPALRSPAGSSQEEYDESESEEERLMASSAEHVHVRRPPTPPQPYAQLQQRAAASDGDGDDEDDDDGTALGLPAAAPPTFRPQPNAFSHPPSHLQQQQQQQQRSVPSPHAHLATPYARQPSSLSQRAGSRTTSCDAGSPAGPPHREDNDAVLRASLTTLLSCAAAARGLPKKESGTYAESSALSPGVRPSNQPMEMRIVPESELMEEETPSAPRVGFSRTRTPPRPQPQPASGTHASRSISRANLRSSTRGSAVSAVSSSSRSKRSAAGASAVGSSRSQRAMKKKRTSSAVDAEASTTFLTPSMMTWMVSAGMVVLVSVVGFGAGFVIGREVGRQEAAASASEVFTGAAPNTSSCSHEIMRSSTGSSLRRFRWGTSMAKSVMA